MPTSRFNPTLRTYKASYRFNLAYPWAWNLERAVKEASNRRVRLGDCSNIDQDLVDAIFGGGPWRQVGRDWLFPDGSVLDDWSDVEVYVKNIIVDPLGLTGDVVTYDVDVTVPPSARWKPVRSRRR